MSHESLERNETIQGSSNRTLGLTFAAVFTIIALFPLIFGQPMRLWSIAVAAVFAMAGLAFPSVLGPLNKAWTRFGLLLHKITSPIVLGFMFFVVVTPIGLLMRLVGKDPLSLKPNRDAASYWVDRTPPGPKPDSLPNQF
jgi:Saxitoxin biosynthesis operon protein SxtJ